jgi:hypothetical protein
LNDVFVEKDGKSGPGSSMRKVGKEYIFCTTESVAEWIDSAELSLFLNKIFPSLYARQINLFRQSIKVLSKNGLCCLTGTTWDEKLKII